MKRIIAVSLIALGLAACTPREQQLVAAGAVGAVAGAVVADSYDRSYYTYNPRPYYYESRPAYNPYVYRVPVMPRRQHCYMVDHRTHNGIRRERVCR